MNARSTSEARARDRVREIGGAELVERLEHLDRVRLGRPSSSAPPLAPSPGERADFDVVFAGGGLSLLHAIGLARRGLTVAVADRARVASGHRAWNASRPELEALVRANVVTAAQLDEELILTRYRHGVCRWHGGGEHVVRGVLDCALDADQLLVRTREAAEQAGVTLLDRTAVEGTAAGRDGVALTMREGGQAGGHARRLVARAVVDARGAASPFASADLACPTVGGVLTGLAKEGPLGQAPDVGDILATTEGIDDGRQHLWEAFPGRPGETTVYLFYYAEAREAGSLLALFARFFDRLPTYKAGDAQMVVPTFGVIPGWSRLTPPPRSPSPRIVLVGDAAARHSPLTFCGFGATLRSLSTVGDRVARAVAGDPTPGTAVDDAVIHRGTGALAALLARPPRAPERRDDLNALLDAAFASLAELGEEHFAALLRDEMAPRDFVRFLQATAARRPGVYAEAIRGLGPVRATRWAAALALEVGRGALGG